MLFGRAICLDGNGLKATNLQSESIDLMMSS